jgi:hypothetical protein
MLRREARRAENGDARADEMQRAKPVNQLGENA